MRLEPSEAQLHEIAEAFCRLKLKNETAPGADWEASGPVITERDLTVFSDAYVLALRGSIEAFRQTRPQVDQSVFSLAISLASTSREIWDSTYHLLKKKVSDERPLTKTIKAQAKRLLKGKASPLIAFAALDAAFKWTRPIAHDVPPRNVIIDDAHELSDHIWKERFALNLSSPPETDDYAGPAGPKNFQAAKVQWCMTSLQTVFDNVGKSSSKKVRRNITRPLLELAHIHNVKTNFDKNLKSFDSPGMSAYGLFLNTFYLTTRKLFVNFEADTIASRAKLDIPYSSPTAMYNDQNSNT